MLPRNVFSIDRLEDAWGDVRRTSKAAGVDGWTPRDFDRNDAMWLRDLRGDLLSERYVPQPLRPAILPKPDGGFRPIGIPTVRDRIAQRALCTFLGERLDKNLTDHSWAFRPRRGVRDVVRRVRPTRGRHVFRFDVEDCFDSLPRDGLESAVKGSVKQPWVWDWIDRVLRVAALGLPFARVPGRGAPQGLPLSPWLCNLILDPLDRSLALECGFYARYADDMVALDDDRRRLGRVQSIAERWLADHGMRLNQGKSLHSDFEAGFRYLGTWFYRDLAMPVLSGRGGRRISGYEGDSAFAEAAFQKRRADRGMSWI